MRLPHNWVPRPYQFDLYDDFIEGRHKRYVAVWHRRAGKDLTAIHMTVQKMMERVGTYWHVFPTYQQAKKAIWHGADKNGQRFLQAFPPELIAKKNETELSIELKNGSRWQLIGSDQYDTLVGSNPIGIVFSEYAIQDPAAWDYMRPMLAENDGWALFIYTPRGYNHGYDLYHNNLENPDWHCEIKTVDDTKAISPEAIEAERKSGMAEDQIQQEFYCSFEGSLSGAYYAEELGIARKQGRIGNVPYDPGLPVFTNWDIGVGDSTAIWFWQQKGAELRFIDFYQYRGKGAKHYVDLIRSKPYTYAAHYFPHDGKKREFGSGETIDQTVTNMGLRDVRIVKVQPIQTRIEKARSIIPISRFDAVNCAYGLKCLHDHHSEFNDKRNVFNPPLHDWTSDAADAFSYAGVVYRGDMNYIDTLPTDNYHYQNTVAPNIMAPKLGVF
jgi:phage terminase large subunit